MIEQNNHLVKTSIMVVDDTHANLHLLTEILTNEGYAVRPVPNGSMALLSAQTSPPELILLDIKMPDISGYDVCKRLKSDEQTRDIPVIFISALHDVIDKVKAFSVGGVDFITKPFQAEEVLARVQIHLTLRHLQQDLQAKNVRLEREIVERQRIEQALRDSGQELRTLNASKDVFFSIIAHDLRGPLASLKGLTEFTFENLDSYQPEKLKEIIALQQKTTENLYKLLENLLTWSRLQRGILEYSPTVIDLQRLIRVNIDFFKTMSQHKQIRLVNRVLEPVKACADSNMVDTIIRNLLSNALKFTPHKGRIEISASQYEETVEIAVTDTGIGIAAEHLEKLFRLETKYRRLGTEHEKGTGLGLILCKDLVEKNGGQIWIESQEDEGSSFRFTLPHALKCSQ